MIPALNPSGRYPYWGNVTGGNSFLHTIITLPANDFMAEIHNEKLRMPAILRAEDVEAWLNGTPEQAKAALIQYPGELLAAHRVSTRVNSPKNDDAQLMEAV